MALDVDLPDRLAERAVDQATPRFQRSRWVGTSRSVFEIEVEASPRRTPWADIARGR
jgi:hypothetical protein